MQIYALCKGLSMPGPLEQPKFTCRYHHLFRSKIIRAMRFTAYLLLACCLHISAKVSSQTITLNGNNLSMKEVFKEIRYQTGLLVFYDLESIRAEKPVTVTVKNVSVETLLQQVLKDRSLTYTIRNNNIIILEKVTAAITTAETPPPTDIGGFVLAADGSPLPGATIRIKGAQTLVNTDASGHFNIKANTGDILVVSFIGFQTREINALPITNMRIVMEVAVSALDEKVVQAYGITSRRLSTSNITKIEGREINRAPVSNVLAALQGLTPGVVINQTSGVPGAAFKVEIRGRTQVDQYKGANNEPLFLLDGIPLAAGNANINLLSSAISGYSSSGLSPLNSINMADIESIEILKDADATAIYGSRGANGVILITTRRGKAGATRFNIDINTGGSRAKIPQMLSTKQYVAMRNEAFANDNKTKTNANAYDLLVWDTTRDNNLPRQLIGGTASITNAQASMSGGSQLVQFRINGGYYRETSVYPGTFPNSRASGQLSLNTSTADHKFNANFDINYSANKNTSTAADLASYIILPPNQALYDSVGGLVWNEKGISTDNPLAYLYNKYTSNAANFLSNALLSYNLLPGLSIRSSIGYNSITVNEQRLTPKTAQNPNTQDLTGMAQFGNNRFASWIVEPQIQYNRAFNKSKLDILAGATYQSQANKGYSFTVKGYTSDEFLGSFSGIPANAFISPNSIQNEYKYQAFFGRINYNYDDKYIVNLSGRRDGSSRFGPNYRFSNFGAIGAAWLFSSENFMKAFPFMSYGKIRASYGITGNDKIGDYKYLDAYTSYLFYPTYNNQTAFTPSALFKPDLHWEKNLKLEIAVETGFFKDRFLFSAAWYRNRSSDPLVEYPLPDMTGFPTITANLKGVLVENRGIEFIFTSNNIKQKNFDWTTRFNLTLPRNRLLRFDGLDQTSYAQRYQIGRSLNLVYVAKYTGIDPNTGLYTIEDVNKNGTFQGSASTAGGDLQPAFDTDPKYYGGMTNTIRYKRLQLDFLLQFTRQQGVNWMGYLIGGLSPLPAGAMQNLPVDALDTWKHPGDNAKYQKLVTANTGPSNAITGWNAAFFSDLRYSDASFLRLKNISISYNLPGQWTKKVRFSNARIYALAENLLTFSKMKVTDPETGFINRLSPLRTITAGLQVGF
ncbi:SusC/RagA family TonB-linked outer membrane protein [Chitinophaga pendula]|uniref:SusC/RagA family TonB-linked outer membrane protein n=1 Tax=Chitinophaga TaxID=79328 RepID=UPI000BAEB797|nr:MULTISPECIES: SusC/RagA family TonB-linked outer membrane protein [Chitinophaga]ASZ12030.1 SusC/RagA family protein [Chitinophaga sp. MD30]UCJ04937.1 SusC/RagA family TonB-linked outer membrane protein [Chitinophaga pendula]